MSSLYISPNELQVAPMGIPWPTMFTGVGQPAATQAWYCQQASALVDNIVGEMVYGPSRPYVLRATLDTESAVTDTQEQTFLDNHGNLVFLARYRPIVSVQSGQYFPVLGNGMTSSSPVPFDMTSVYWEGREIVHLGPFLGFGTATLRVSVTYIDGYANATLTGNAALGAATLAVDDGTGITAGQQLTIYDMPPESVFVSSTFVPFQGPGNVPLQGSTAAAHAIGVRVSAMESDIQLACIFLVQHLIQTKAQIGAAPARELLKKEAVPFGATNYFEMALDLLDAYIVTP